MDRRTALRTITAAALSTVAAPAILRGRYRLFAQGSAEYSARTIGLMRGTTVIDMLRQFSFEDFRTDEVPLAVRWRKDPRSFTAEHFAMFRDSGVNVMALGSGPTDYEEAIRFYAEWNGFIASHSDWFTRIDDAGELVRSAVHPDRIEPDRDVRTARKSSRPLGFHDSPFDDRVAILRRRSDDHGDLVANLRSPCIHGSAQLGG